MTPPDTYLDNYGGPWRAHEGFPDIFITKNGRTGSITIEGGENEYCFINAAVRDRVVACVNACAGIPTEELERRVKK